LSIAGCDVQDLEPQQGRGENLEIAGLELRPQPPRLLDVLLALRVKPLDEHRRVEDRLRHRASRAARIAAVDSSAD
jgi:hypothetical protein